MTARRLRHPGDADRNIIAAHDAGKRRFHLFSGAVYLRQPQPCSSDGFWRNGKGICPVLSIAVSPCVIILIL